MAQNLDQIVDMIKKLDLHDDGINMNQKIKCIEMDFCNLIKDEKMLSDSMDYINEKVLADSDASLKFAMLFSSRNFDSLAMHDSKVRCKMLHILEKNFSNSVILKRGNKNMLYNSITLLGEYYHRVRLADGSPIDILGQSLLQLLLQEIKYDNDEQNPAEFTDYIIDSKLAKLILSQITLNGSILKKSHQNQLNLLLFYIRKNLIEQEHISKTSKALLLMTLDLYYNNFNSLTPSIEKMYTKYLVEEEEKQLEKDPINDTKSVEDLPISTKKWSEQVFEDNMYESELTDNTDQTNNSFSDIPNTVNQHEEIEYQSLPAHHKNYQEDCIDENISSGLNDYTHRSNDNISGSLKDSAFSSQDQKSVQQRLYNTNNNKYINRNNRNSNRYSGNFEDDKNSIRSEGGSIRLYNVHDRTQSTKSDRDYCDNRGYQNWDKSNNYQHYDNRHRSTSRNKQQDNNYNNRNRNTYDRPPRFRNIESQSWRNGSQEKKYNRSHSKDDDSRSSSINRTFPRSNRQGSYDSYNTDNVRNKNIHPGQNLENVCYNNSKSNENAFYNSRQTEEKTNGPNLYNKQRPQQSRNFGRTNNDNRYGSHFSLNSNDSNSWQHRGRPRNRNSYRRKSQDWSDTKSLHENEIISDNKWSDVKGNNEIAKNARSTAKYMQYLSQKN